MTTTLYDPLIHSENEIRKDGCLHEADSVYLSQQLGRAVACLCQVFPQGKRLVWQQCSDKAECSEELINKVPC